MYLSGFNPNSYIDYPGKIAAVVFLGGCNFNCFYCHNRDLIRDAGSLSEEEILAKIKKRLGFLEAVVISGGEPTLKPLADLKAFIKKIKDLGLLVKLDTNGSDPEKLRALLADVDYVAMDVKAPLSKYERITPVPEGATGRIAESIEIVKAFGYEFRTTVTAETTLSDIEEIARLIGGGKAKYFLQKLVPPPHNPALLSPSAGFLKEARERAEKYAETAIRGI
jgi:anaerobic ribonucleoside-triphosphate reductase activating protein